jgi:hypothetical protein
MTCLGMRIFRRDRVSVNPSISRIDRGSFVFLDAHCKPWSEPAIWVIVCMARVDFIVYLYAEFIKIIGRC